MPVDIPHLYDIPPRKVPLGQSVTKTVSKKHLRAMVVALECVGLLVRVEKGQYSCRANGVPVLTAKKGNRGTYLVRYASGVDNLVEKMK